MKRRFDQRLCDGTDSMGVWFTFFALNGLWISGIIQDRLGIDTTGFAIAFGGLVGGIIGALLFRLFGRRGS